MIMLTKLAIRNAKRSIRDYLIYIITMIGIAGLMFAFNSMLFNKSIKQICVDATSMLVMISVSTFFIVIIVAWLINYMVKFMMQKRSREFATYLLMGMKRKQISRLYMRENLLMGIIGFAFGMVLGVVLQQIIMTVFYSVFSKSYSINIQLSLPSILMTIGCYFGCYLLALFRNKKTFKKMNISDMMQLERKNEEIHEKHEKAKRWLAAASIIYFIVFIVLMLRGNYSVLPATLMICGFFAAIYFFYIGFASALIVYLRNGGKSVYKNQNLFIYRQMSSKLKTMRFTMGTLTVLIMCAILGGSVAMMFARYQDKALRSSMPFDVLVYSKDASDTFEKELSVIEKLVGIDDSIVYKIYQNGSHVMNDYLYTHANTVDKKYRNDDGTVNYKAVKSDGYEYYDYDTFMRLSDYNKLRQMLGKKQVKLADDEYYIQIKKRLIGCLNKSILNRKIRMKNTSLKCAGVQTIDFSQNGINGADYMIVVPDKVADTMKPYYSDLAAATVKKGTQELQDKLHDIRLDKNGILPEKEFDKKVDEGKISDDEDWEDVTLGGCGTDQIIVFAADVIVGYPLGRQLKVVMTSITFPIVYIGLVFVCVALTIMAVQQLSDSNKFKFRYDVLRKLGLSEHELNHLVFKQLFGFYLVPAIMSLALSAFIAIFAGNNFVKYTGANGNGIYYYGIALIVFFGVYLIYFMATYIGFKRNIAGILKKTL